MGIEIGGGAGYPQTGRVIGAGAGGVGYGCG